MKITLSSEYEFCSCSECGMPYGVPQSWIAEKTKDHRTFYCPNGHQQIYAEEKDEPDLDEMLYKKANLHLEQRLEHEINRNRALKGQITKLRNKLDTH